MAFHCRKTSHRLAISQHRTGLFLLLIVVVTIGCTSKRKTDVDLYLETNINTQADIERELEKAKAFQDAHFLNEMAKSADTTPGDILGALEVKGFSQQDIQAAAKKAGIFNTPFSNASSGLNWNPAAAKAVPPRGLDPDAIYSMGPKEFAKVVAGLEIARVELEQLANSQPHDWSLAVHNSQCRERKMQNVCIAQESFYGEYINKKAFGCSDKNMFLVSSPAEIRAALEKLEADCVQIDKLELHSHGTPGGMAMGLSVSNVDPIFLSMYHLFTPRSKIHLMGCSVGKACIGSVLMLKMARQAYWQSGGYIEAPTVTIYASRLTDYKSIFTDDSKHLRYSSLNQAGEWVAQSPKAQTEMAAPLTDVCRNEISENIEKIERTLAESKNLKNCSIFRVSVRSETLYSIERSVRKILELPEKRLDNLRLRALANVSDLLQKHVNELSVQCK